MRRLPGQVRSFHGANTDWNYPTPRVRESVVETNDVESERGISCGADARRARRENTGATLLGRFVATQGIVNEKEQAAGLPETPGYRYAKKLGDRLFVAGQVPNDASGVIVGLNDPYQQAQQCIDNLLTILNVHQFNRKDIQQLTVYVVGNQENLGAAWQAVRDVFSGDVPPATLLGVARLGYDGQLVEIDATIIAER